MLTLCLAPYPPHPPQSLLSQHAPVMRSLTQLTSLHMVLPLDQPGLSLGTLETQFVSCLTRLEDLALASPWRQQGEHFLPASLPPSLKSLQASRGVAGWQAGRQAAGRRQKRCCWAACLHAYVQR